MSATLELSGTKLNMDSPKKDNQDKTGDQKKEKRGFFKRKKK